MINFQIQSFIALLKFLGLYPIRSVREKYLILQASENKTFQAICYYSDNPDFSPVIYLQHGMNIYGMNDPRIKKLARSIASVGYTVVVPELPEVKNLVITTKTISNIRECLLSIYKLFQKQIGYIAPSLTAGLGIIAISEREIQSLVSSILLIGSYSDFHKSMNFCKANYANDSYGFFILLYNFINHLVNNSENLKKLLFEMAVFTASSPKINLNKTAEFDSYRKISSPEKKLIEKLLKEFSYRDYIIDQISILLEPDFFYSMSPINFVKYLDVPTFYVHGLHDTVSSKESTISLYKCTPKRCISDIIISELLVHGDICSLHKQISNFASLSKIFGKFLSYSALSKN